MLLFAISSLRLEGITETEAAGTGPVCTITQLSCLRNRSAMALWPKC
jgi:hypothetical protein